MALCARRQFLRSCFAQLGLCAIGGSLVRCGGSPQPPPPAEQLGSGYNPPTIVVPTSSNVPNLGPLLPADGLGLRLPAGFSARIVAQSQQPVAGTEYNWHPAPDGGATFLANDGGYVYVSNSESLFEGGASALRFDEDGTLLDAYSILGDTRINCAGGATPWGTWLSCEEVASGQVWECDPFGKHAALVRPALGTFKHEAVAVDPVANHLYLTEDEKDGRLYRFTPSTLTNGRPDLSAGKLEVLQVASGEQGAVTWLPLPDPSGVSAPTRDQVADSASFDGGEGIWWHQGVVYFTTKGDNRVWAYDTTDEALLILYDDDVAPDPILTGVDNVTVTPAGDILVAEDGGDMQIVALVDGGQKLVPLVQVEGQADSEITGPALDPYRRRLYFSSQRGRDGGILGNDGITYEISGPFFVD